MQAPSRTFDNGGRWALIKARAREEKGEEERREKGGKGNRPPFLSFSLFLSLRFAVGRVGRTHGPHTWAAFADERRRAALGRQEEMDTLGNWAERDSAFPSPFPFVL